MFMAEVREELAHSHPGDHHQQLAETAALLRIGGTLELVGGLGPDGIAIVVPTSSGAVARRLHAALRRIGDDRPDVEVHAPHGLQRTTLYRVRLSAAAALLSMAGIIDDDGHLRAVPAPSLTTTEPTLAAYLRGALMVGGSITDPRRDAHLEVATGTEASAEHLAGLLRRAGAHSVAKGVHRERWRIVIKSGSQIGAVLATVGAHQSFLRWDEGRLRRELRGAANRAANADRANVARSVTASAEQTEAIHRVIAGVGLDELPLDLAAVALARLANPEASLGQLGELLDPPVGKATVHRRLGRLLTMDPTVG